MNPSPGSTRKRYNQKYSPEERKGHDDERERQILEDLHVQNQGSLFKMKFWRVILDEAHTIKDPSSQSESISVRGIMLT